MRSITLLGSSSGRNAGDAALIAGIMESIDEQFNERLLYEIPTLNPDFIWKTYPNKVRPVSLLPWNLTANMMGLPLYLSTGRSDLTLIFDAPLFDREFYNPLFNYLSSFSLILPQVRKKGKLMGCYNVGVGPIKTSVGEKALQKVCGLMDFIAVRDEGSRKVLAECNVPLDKVVVTADAALNMRSSTEERTEEILRNAGFDLSKQILAVNVSKYLDTWAGTGTEPLGKEKFLKIFVEALHRIKKEINPQLLLVGTQHHDVPLTDELCRMVEWPEHKKVLSNLTLTPYEVKGILGRANLLVGMRLHATILATSSHTPTVALPHQPKVEHYFEALGLSERVLTFKDFSADTLSELILKGWNDQDKIRETLDNVIPNLKKKAHQGAAMVHALMNGKDPIKEFSYLNS